MTREPVTIDGGTGTLDPSPCPKQIPLASLKDVRREMADVYRRARRGAIDTSEAGRLAYILTGIGKLIEAEDIENRITRLEDMQENRRLT